MTEGQNPIGFSLIKSREEGMELLDKLASTARPEAVFSPPQTYGEYTLITTTEVMSGLGFGFGGGYGFGDPGESEKAAPTSGEQQADQSDRNGGMGGGGGGFSSGRPVAVITVGPNGVRVKPIVDITKIGLAFLATAASFWVSISQITRLAHKRG